MLKTVTTLALAALMAGASTMSFAEPVKETSGIVASDASNDYVPAVCDQAGTKDAHPGWYNMGGYCNPFDYDD